MTEVLHNRTCKIFLNPENAHIAVMQKDVITSLLLGIEKIDVIQSCA
jgi:hypothetical protein